MWLAILLVVSIIGLITAAVLGVDKGVLRDMATPEYARGLITFLFAVVTISSAFFLIIAGLVEADDEAREKQFQHGKEVLSLLLGVFGTIVGYYFGSTHAGSSAVALRISGIEVLPTAGPPGSAFTAAALVAGGTPPYRYVMSFGAATPKAAEQVSENGVIKERLTIPGLPPGKTPSVVLTVEDAVGRKVTAFTSITITSK